MPGTPRQTASAHLCEMDRLLAIGGCFPQPGAPDGFQWSVPQDLTCKEPAGIIVAVAWPPPIGVRGPAWLCGQILTQWPGSRATCPKRRHLCAKSRSGPSQRFHTGGD
jgi:hypothetical protein